MEPSGSARSPPAPNGITEDGAARTARLASGLPEASLASIVTRPGFFDVPPMISAF